MPEPFEEAVEAALGHLSYQDRERILRNLIWEVFGDVDNDEQAVLLPDRGPDRVDVLSLCAGLRQELWPERYPDGAVPAAATDSPPVPATKACDTCGRPFPSNRAGATCSDCLLTIVVNTLHDL